MLMKQKDNVWRKAAKSVVDFTNYAIDVANSLEIENENIQLVTNVRNKGRFIKHVKDETIAHANKCLEYYYSEQRQIELEEADRIKRSYKRMQVISSVICIIIIGVTIACCVTGNDIILNYLRLQI